MNAKFYIDSEASTIRAEGNVTEVLTCAWFRWENCRDSGQYLTGAEVAALKPTNIQIFHDGAWHPVAAFYGAVCAPVDDYLQEVGA